MSKYLKELATKAVHYIVDTTHSHVARIPLEEAKVFELSKFWKVMGYDTAIKLAPLVLTNFDPPRLLEDGSIEVEDYEKVFNVFCNKKILKVEVREGEMTGEHSNKEKITRKEEVKRILRELEGGKKKEIGATQAREYLCSRFKHLKEVENQPLCEMYKLALEKHDNGVNAKDDGARPSSSK
ncbi:hypothetical protein F2Q69_00050070 [Brassica cretica]|uniref:Uncharacterized protein n=1 Tax=Brassica cretica TaxID=69181 RepID=A0A8S9Q0E1_BRACR|nr:hypothetical protein F2Q69_00050070 [Brassica cretica]